MRDLPFLMTGAMVRVPSGLRKEACRVDPFHGEPSYRERFAQAIEYAQARRLPITRDEFAAHFTCSRATAYRYLSRLRSAGVLDPSNRPIRVRAIGPTKIEHC